MALIFTINRSTPNDGLGDTLYDEAGIINDNFASLNANKVEVSAGFGLSENNYSDVDKAKLDSIDIAAQTNVQPDWLQADNTKDDYIKNKPNVGSFLILDGIIGVTTGFAVGQQSFTLPVANSKCLSVYLNGAKQYMTTPNNSSLTTRWSQTGDIVTITKTTVLNNYIYIEFQ